MAFNIIYKTLFQVRILHDYFLKNPEDFHAISTGEQEEDQLQELYLCGYNILDALIIEPTPDCLRMMRGHHMRFRAHSAGFEVAVHVVERLQGATKIYEPMVPLSEGLKFAFRLRLRDINFVNYTNLRVKPNLPANFYFSNCREPGALNYPYLSLTNPEYASGRRYEMGEWVNVTNGGVSTFQATVNVDSVTAPNGPGPWEAFGSLVRYANYQDQMLLPNKFPYFFTYEENNPFLDAEFILTDPNSSTGDAANVQVGGTGVEAFTSHLLDFSEVPDGPYLLEVLSTNGYADQKEILIDSEKWDRKDFGIIDIGHQAGLGDFRLLEAQGHLRMEGSETVPPVFQIAFRNRATYWQYFFHSSNDVGSIGDPDYDVFADDGYIVTKEPILLSYAGQQLKIVLDTNADLDLPNPTDPVIKPRPDKFYSEIYLPKVEL